MQKEHSFIKITLCDCRTCFIICGQIRQFIICAKSFSIMTRSYSSCQIILLTDNIIPDCINGLYIGRVARQCCYISHTRIHISCTNSMPFCLFLIYYRSVTLRISISYFCLASIIKKIFSLIKIFFISGKHI